MEKMNDTFVKHKCIMIQNTRFVFDVASEIQRELLDQYKDMEMISTDHIPGSNDSVVIGYKLPSETKTFHREIYIAVSISINHSDVHVRYRETYNPIKINHIYEIGRGHNILIMSINKKGCFKYYINSDYEQDSFVQSIITLCNNIYQNKINALK